MIKIILKETLRPTERDAEHFDSRKLEKQEENILKNAIELYKMMPRDKIPWSLYNPNTPAEDMIIDFARRAASVEPFKDSIITKKLGEGLFGVAFLLSNGNVLKFGEHDQTEKADQQIIVKMRDRIFSGKARRNTLYPISYGNFPVRDMKNIYWREVPFYKEPPQNLFFKDCEQVAQYFIDLYYKKDFSVDKERAISVFIKDFFSEVGFKKTTVMVDQFWLEKMKRMQSYIDVPTLREFLKAVVDAKKSSHQTVDFHAGNLGIDNSGRMVFFDF